MSQPRRAPGATTVDAALKTCTKCGETKPATEEYFFRRSSGALRADCKACRRRYYRRKYREDPEFRSNVLRINRASNRRRRDAITRYTNSWRSQRYRSDPDYRERLKAWIYTRRKIDRTALFQREGGVCCYCGSSCDPDDFHIAHQRHQSNGGTNELWNLRVAHPECNHRAGRTAPGQPLLPGLGGAS